MQAPLVTVIAKRMSVCDACNEPIQIGEKYHAICDMKNQKVEHWHIECACEVGEYSIGDQPVNPNE